MAEQQSFLRQIIDLNPNLIFAKDREGRFTLVNQAVAEMYGTTVDELIGKTDADFNPNAEEVAHFRRVDLQVMNTQREHVVPEEAITDAKGRLHWLRTVKRPIIGPDGVANQVLGVAVDITELKLAEQRHALMMRELDHRVKNNLFAVIALAEQMAGQSNSLDDFLHAFTGRVRSMAVAHEVLAQRKWQAIDLEAALRRVLDPYVHDHPQRVSLSGSGGDVGRRVLLPPRVCSPLCMVLHELATNAIKYGALSSDGGEVAITWSLSSGRLRLHWRETGGPPVTETKHRGFGTDLIEGITRHQMRGEAKLCFAPGGVQCTIDIPLEAVDVHP